MATSESKLRHREHRVNHGSYSSTSEHLGFRSYNIRFCGPPAWLVLRKEEAKYRRRIVWPLPNHLRYTWRTQPRLVTASYVKTSKRLHKTNHLEERLPEMSMGRVRVEGWTLSLCVKQYSCYHGFKRSILAITKGVSFEAECPFFVGCGHPLNVTGARV